MNDSRFPVFRKHKDRVASSSLLPLMEERRVLKPPLSSRSASGQGTNAKSSRLPKPSSSSSKPSSSRPMISRPISQPRSEMIQPTRMSSGGGARASVKQSFLPSTSLPYLDHAPRTSSLSTVASSSSSSSSSSRRNLSVSTVHQYTTRTIEDAAASALEARPHSFPPLHKKRNTSSSTSTSRSPPRVYTQDPSNDPFKVYANRVLRPSASSSTVHPSRSSLPSNSPSSLVLPPRSSSLTTTNVADLDLSLSPRDRFHPSCSLRRTATVRSATSATSSGARHRVPPPPRVAGGHHFGKRRKPSISGTESFLMVARSSSSGLNLARSKEGGGMGRSGRVLLGPSGLDRDSIEAEEEIEIEEELEAKDLIQHWKAFVGVSDDRANGPSALGLAPERGVTETKTFSLIDQSPPLPTATFDSPSLPRAVSSSKPDRSRILSIASAPRELAETLPQLNRYLHTRAPSHPPSESSSALSASGAMTRVDSEVLLTRLTLKRLGSTGFEGDALDKLGRGEGDEQVGTNGGARDGAWDDVEDLRNVTVEEEEIEDWADQYRDSFDGWDEYDNPHRSKESLPPSPTRSTGSSSSASTTSSRSSWKWDPSSKLATSASSSTVSSSTSIGTLSRNWSKSTLMEELEREVGRLSRDFDHERQVGQQRDQDEDGDYVCALDLIFEEEDDSNSESDSGAAEVPVRRGGGPLLVAPPLETTNDMTTTALGPAPAAANSISRLPRLKPQASTANLRTQQQLAPSRIVPPVPRAFVSKLATPNSVASKYRVGAGTSSGAGGAGRGVGAGVRSKAGWV